MSDFLTSHAVRFGRMVVVLALAAGALATGGSVGAQEVGEVTYVQGVASAQRPGGEPRFLGKGDAILKGEVVNTSERGYAVLGLKDGTKLTLRANTAFAVNELNLQPGSENLAMNLLRGGLRAFTGLISKTRPRAATLITPTATVGIRGTEFDARLCGADCAREAPFARPVVASQNPVVARVVALNGGASAVAGDGSTRSLGQGSALYNGESVRTGAGSHAVLAFRDQTKLTLIEKTDFRLEDVRITGPSGEGNFVTRLVTGGLRAFTGLIGKRDRNSVRFITPTATVGIRGTGIDLRVEGANAYLYTWDGAAALEADGRELLVEKERAGSFEPQGGGLVLLGEVPRYFIDEIAPRPDLVDVDFDGLFLVRRLDDVVPGFYVGVRKGDVRLGALGGRALFLDLGEFEAALLADGSDAPQRIGPPGFLFNDPIPLPDNVDLRPLRLIELVGPGRLSASDQCLLQ